ncbi:MAG: RagB/SusD family nutrient uptake outer membrane protein [Sphingobacteriia bacterium]|nr:RagB/SusD family nutrient uptake outer membrane protein [Sphingobacteriia bacterium]
MKKISYFIIILISLTSCAKVLDVEPYQSISPEDALKDKTGIERAITGSYSVLGNVGSYGRYQIIVSDLAADNLDWVATSVDYSEIDQNDINANNIVIDGIWSANYDGINRVNNILHKLPDIPDLTENERNLFEGEARFLRALFHFNLVNFFGGVPVKTQPTLDLSNIDQARNTRDEVYLQIIEDLTIAEEKLPASVAPGHTGSFSASALLARVYLTRFHLSNVQEDAAKAIEKANKVINEGGFTLTENYADLFNGSNSEIIFQVVFDAQNYNRIAQNFFPISLKGLYIIAPSADYMTCYDPIDSVRFTNSAMTDSTGKSYCNKYRDIVTGTDRVMVLRLAEMYLIKAEALAYTNGNLDEIKASIDIVRARAGLPGTTASGIEELKTSVENERRYEFAFEGHRWHDLVRTGRATAVMGIDKKRTLFPIPLSEMQTNKKMTQNEGY